MLRPKLVERKLVGTAGTVDTADSAEAQVIAELQCIAEPSVAAFGERD